MRCVDLLVWIPENLYWLGLHEMPFGPHEDHRGVIRDVYKGAGKA